MPSSGQEIIDLWLSSSLCHYAACCLIGPQEYVDTRVNPSCLHFSRGSIKRILFIFPMVTLYSVYSVVCLVRSRLDLCQRFCFRTQAFLQSLLASSEVVTFWTSSRRFGTKNKGVMQTELWLTSSWCSYFTGMFTFLSQRIAGCHTKAGEKWHQILKL